MIITLTCNPAIDKTAYVDKLQPGSLHRLQGVVQSVGGKGINVSKTLRALHTTSLAMGFLGGSSGAYIADMLREYGIEQDFLWIDDVTRTNVKLVESNGVLTELNEPGPTILPQQAQELTERLLTHVRQDTLVVLSGKLSCGMREDFYKNLIHAIHAKGGSVLLDAEADALRLAIQAEPEIIKPNWQEICTYFHVPMDISMPQMIAKAKTLLKGKTKLIVISMGKDGALFLTPEAIWHANALAVKARSSVGAGDAMVAGIAYAKEMGYAMNDMITLAVACGGGAVMSEGTEPAPWDVVKALRQQVSFMPFG